MNLQRVKALRDVRRSFKADQTDIKRMNQTKLCWPWEENASDSEVAEAFMRAAAMSATAGIRLNHGGH